MKYKFILYILLILSLFTFILTSFSYAENEVYTGLSFTYNNVSYTYDTLEHYKNVVIVYNPTSYGLLFNFYSSTLDNFAYSDGTYLRLEVNPEDNSLVSSGFIYDNGRIIYSQTSANNIGGRVSLNVAFSNFDIKDTSGNIVHKSDVKKLELNLTVEPTEKTKNVPITITSDWYVLDDFNTSLNVYADNEAYNEFLHIPNVENPIGVEGHFGSIEVSKNEEGKNIYRYVYKVYHNGTYKFKLFSFNDLETTLEETILINNIEYTQDTINNYVNGVFDPTPFLSYEYVNDNLIYITTQKFFINELIDLQCFYIKKVEDEEIDFESNDGWTKVEDPRAFHDNLSDQDVFQFYFPVDNSSFDADGTYYVKFYNVFLDKYTYSSINICFEDILKINGSLLFKYVNFFKERFGFFVYPFELFFDLLNRFKTVDFSEPEFIIPDIYDPVTNTKIISSTNFNFNDFLENDVFNNIHNIYLIVVDVIIVFSLVMLLKNKIMGVFEK